MLYFGVLLKSVIIMALKMLLKHQLILAEYLVGPKVAIKYIVGVITLRTIPKSKLFLVTTPTQIVGYSDYRAQATPAQPRIYIKRNRPVDDTPRNSEYP